MLRLHQLAVWLLATLFLSSTIATELHQQDSPSGNVEATDQKAFDRLLKGVPDVALHQALSGHFAAFKDGIFDRERTAAQALHEEDPNLATKVVEAARDLKKRQLSLNENATVVITTSTESPPTTTVTSSQPLSTSSESQSTSQNSPPPTSSSTPIESSSSSETPVSSSSSTSASNAPSSQSSQESTTSGTSSSSPNGNTGDSSSDGPSSDGYFSGGSSSDVSPSGTTSGATSVPPRFSMPLKPNPTPIPSSVLAGLSIEPQGSSSDSVAASSDLSTSSSFVPTTSSSSPTSASPTPTSAPVTTSTHVPGKMVVTTDQFGNQITLFGATNGAVITATDANGQVVTTTYHPGGGTASSEVLKTSTLPNGSPTTLTSVAVIGVSGPAGASATDDTQQGTSTKTGQAGLVTGNAAVASRKMGKEVVALVGGAVGVAWLL